jgi:hypothetical protein
VSLELTWTTRNKLLQADMPVDHFAASVTAPAGLQTVCKWYWRANPGDPLGEPEIHIVDDPIMSDTFDPPGDGWVRLESYTQLNGLGCWQPYEWEGFYIGTGLYTPGNRITDAGNDRITDAGDTRITE